MQEKTKKIIRTIYEIFIFAVLIIAFFKILSPGELPVNIKNGKMQFFNTSNRTLETHWNYGDKLYYTKSREDKSVIISEEEECNNMEGCVKFWNKLGEGEQLVVIIDKAEDPGIIILDNGDVLKEELCKNLGKITVIHKKGCVGCSKAIPILQEIENETNMEFDYYDVSDKEERDELLSFGFNTKFVPVIIKDCIIYSGAKEKEEYEKIIRGEGDEEDM